MSFYTRKIYRNSTEILKLVAAFERCTLPLAQWNHETYLTVAFCYVYLNPLPEAGRLMGESILRYGFENNLNLYRQTDVGEREMSALLEEMNDYVKRYKAFLSFVALANLVQERFADQNPPLKNYQNASAFFPNEPLIRVKAEEAR
jgi:hypothetical protein